MGEGTDRGHFLSTTLCTRGENRCEKELENFMDKHSIKVLEFDKIVNFLKTFTTSPGGRHLCGTLMPFHDQQTIERLLKQVTEMRGVLEVHGHIPINGIRDIEKSVARARIYNFYLGPKELLAIKETLEVARSVKGFFAELQDTCPLLHNTTAGIIPLRECEARINQSISPRAEILDTASPELAEIRGRIKNLRLSIIKTLEKLLHEEDLQHVFQEDFITLRNNRYVLPVRTDCKGAVPGVVHDQSQSKATFFIEPLAVVNANNELQILRKEESYEEIKILTDLTRFINQYQDEIVIDLQILENVDLIHAKALLSKALNAREAHLNTEGTIELRHCRHPILLSQFIEEKQPENENPAKKEIKGHWEFNRSGVVPIDLVKDQNTSTLIITGANAGGKTVALKTLGLFTLMTQAGMHIPAAEGSRLAVYHDVFADIGDEQNIEASLSTFSAHVMQIDQIVKKAGPSALVLLDELGSGTDPSEGSALALAVLDFLRERGCFTVVTSHLNLLKTYAYLHADVKNVSVAFDPATLKPQYNLVYGMPGLSNALAIARNLGMSESILARANNYLKDSDRQAMELIQGLEKTQKEILKEKEKIRALKQKAQTYEEKTRQFLENIRSSREKMLKSFEHDARKLLRESEAQLMQIIRDKKKIRLVRPGEEKNEFLAVKKKLYDRFPKTAYHKEAVEHLKTGQVIRVSHLQKDGIVAAVDQEAQKAEVVIGTMRIKTAFKDLELPKNKRQRPASPKTPEPSYRPTAPEASLHKINVIGLRVEEALPVVDKTIDQAIMQGIDKIEIIHGTGTGRLMKAIRDYLKDHRYVARFESGDIAKGGAGITIVETKG